MTENDSTEDWRDQLTVADPTDKDDWIGIAENFIENVAEKRRLPVRIVDDSEIIIKKKAAVLALAELFNITLQYGIKDE